MTLTGKADVPRPNIEVGNVLRSSLSLWSKLILPFSLTCCVSTIPDILEARDGQPHRLYFDLFYIASGPRALTFALLGLILTSLANGSAIAGTLRLIEGERPLLAPCLEVAYRRFVPLCGVSLISNLFLAAGVLAMAVPGLIAATLLFVTMPVCVTERLGVIESVRRSLQLTTGTRWRLLLLTIVLIFVFGIEGGYESAIAQLYGGRVPFTIEVIGQGMLSLFCAVVMTVVYCDLISRSGQPSSKLDFHPHSIR